MTRRDKVLNGAAFWGAFYRANPDLFAKDYLHLNLRIFQDILLVIMFWSSTFVFIACRGLGKTFLSAIYCVIRCILYPGTKICIASGTRGQAINVLEKILYELKPRSPELCNEIDDKETKINGTNAQIVFKNSSSIKVVTASDSARGNRCNVLLLDEFRLINKDTIDTILRKFLTLKREPAYRALSKTERKKELAKEKNLTLYLTSAYWKDHWSYTRCVDTLKAMVNPSRRQFVCGFPYHLSIKEGLLDPELVADEMAESDFSEVKFSMEMESLFWGADDGAFFDNETVSKNRKIKYPMLPSSQSSLLSSTLIQIPQKQKGETRILSVDVGLMSSRRNKNDATAIFLNQLVPTKAGRYVSNIVYADSCEGLRTDDQALVIRKLYDEFNCDYIVLDTNGIGLGVYDTLARDISDPETGEIYPAISCCNDKTMAERCTVPGADRVIWSIKASAQFNSDCAILLRDGFKTGRVRLLVNEYDAADILSTIRGYNSLSDKDRLRLKLPYIHTTLLIEELIKLQHDETSGRVRVYERAGMRKDRYSSLSYNFYVATQLENKLVKKTNLSSGYTQDFIIRAPGSMRKAVDNDYGRL